VRDVHGLVYGVYSAARIGKNRSTFSIEYACDPDKILPAQALILSDLRNLATNGLVPNDLVRGRAELVSRIPMRAASFDGIATQLIDYAQLGLPLDQATIDARSEIGVTNDQVKAAVAKWIRQGDFVRVIEGPGPKT
jgi:zinc protease